LEFDCFYAFPLQSRIKILNEKVEHVKGVVSTLMDDLKHKDSIRLERIIVALICIEVLFGVTDHWEQLNSWLGLSKPKAL
jgi:uncharacterized Rmd1/YagE family protein